MNRLSSIVLLCFIAFSACQKESKEVAPAGNPATTGTPDIHSMMRYSGSDYSQPICKDTANRMIQSYLNSINYPSSDNNLRSLTFDADTLRAYLADSKIVTLKFMLAHRQSYMNSGYYGSNCGTRADALTFIIVGLDESDNYVYNSRSMVYDNTRPCPTDCGSNYSAVLY